MDDYYIIVPPDRDAKYILELIIAKVESLKLTVSRSKTCIVPLTKPFKYCKLKYTLMENGRVAVNGCRGSMKRARRKFKAYNLRRHGFFHQGRWLTWHRGVVQD